MNEPTPHQRKREAAFESLQKYHESEEKFWTRYCEREEVPNNHSSPEEGIYEREED